MYEANICNDLVILIIDVGCVLTQIFRNCYLILNWILIAWIYSLISTVIKPISSIIFMDGYSINSSKNNHIRSYVHFPLITTIDIFVFYSYN